MTTSVFNSVSGIALGAALVLAGCASGNQEKPKSASKGESSGGDGVEEDGDEGLSGGLEAGGTEVFTAWCKKAGEISPSKKELKRFYQAFCDGGKPTTLLKSRLIGSNAYSGSGTPKVVEIEEFKNDSGAKTTTGYLGVGIKLPIPIKTHFDKVGPKGGDVNSLKKLATAQGATGEVDILQEYENDGKYHVRGWKVHTKNTKDLVVTKLVTETESRSDQFQLDEGESYAYTQITLESMQGIKDLSMLTAGIKVGNASYLITQAYVVADNKGLPSAAPGQIRDLAKGLIKAMYKAAEEAK